MVPHRNRASYDPKITLPVGTDFGSIFCLHFHPLQKLQYLPICKFPFLADTFVCTSSNAFPESFWTLCTSDKTRRGTAYSAWHTPEDMESYTTFEFHTCQIR